MYEKLNNNRKFKIFLAGLAVFMMLAFILVLPFDQVHAQSLGLPFGGRVVASVITGYYWGFGYCPPHLVVANLGPPYMIGQPFGVFIPPVVPKAYYNYYTPGVAILGSYFPTPMPYCPFYPVYFSSTFGTSLTP